MEKARLELHVSVEKAIHEVLQKVLQEIWDDHKLCVIEISVDWFDASTPAEPKMMLTGLDMRSTTKV